MQSWSWAPQHCDALREFVAAGLSFAEAAAALNEKFGTAYTRNAVIGRAKRMKLAVRVRHSPARGPNLRIPKQKQLASRTQEAAVRQAGAEEAAPVTSRAEPVKLRCVGVQPRLLSFDQLADDDCRYPYGGDRDGEAITFCGHPRYRGTSYCAPHFHLTRGPRIEAERPAGPFTLRLVEAA